MKHTTILILPLALLILCCGCSNTDSQRNKTKNTTEGTASSAYLKNGKNTVKKNRFENDYIRIWREEDERGNPNVCMQEKLDGTDRKQTANMGYRFLWLDNNWVYYVYALSDPNVRTDIYTICRVPIDRKDKTTFLVEKREKLFQTTLFDDTEFLVTDSYIFYGAYLTSALFHETITYFRYDFQTKKSEQIFHLELAEDACKGELRDFGIYQECPANLPVTLGNAFFVGGAEGLFRVPFDTLEPEKIYSGKVTNADYLNYSNSHQTDSLMVVCDDALYFTPTGKEIMKYDGAIGEVSCILKEKTLQDMQEKLELWDKERVGSITSVVEGLFIHNNRFYINVNFYWEKLNVHWEKLKTDGELYQYAAKREVLLSAPLSDFTDWKLEEALSKYILENACSNYLYQWSEASYRKQKYLPESLVETENNSTLSRASYLYDMGDGKILASYFSFSPDKNKKPDGVDGVEKEVLYDIDSRKISDFHQDYPAYFWWLWRRDFSERSRSWPEFHDFEDN